VAYYKQLSSERTLKNQGIRHQDIKQDLAEIPVVYLLNTGLEHYTATKRTCSMCVCRPCIMYVCAICGVAPSVV
jgi:hypothetical protein